MKTRPPKLLCLAGMALALLSRPLPAAGGPLGPFLGEARFDSRELFRGRRFPTMATATDGTALAFVSGRLRRSEDGGATWGGEIELPGRDAALVDEAGGGVLRFDSRRIYLSADHGLTWTLQPDTAYRPNRLGHLAVSTHGAETGITLRHGKRPGRLLQATRLVGQADYNAAMYSDDGGRSWQATDPVPARGTGEGTLAELSDGRVYYNSRRHRAPEGEDPRKRHISWSHDDGETWRDGSTSEVLPDGMRGNDYGCKGGLLRLPVSGADILVYTNLDADGGWGNSGGRRDLTAWASFDGARSWPLKRLVFDGPGSYSSLSAGRPGTPGEGTIFILHEAGESSSSETVRLTRVNLSWLLEGEKTGDGRVPEWVARALAGPGFAHHDMAAIAVGAEKWPARRAAAWNLSEPAALAAVALYDPHPLVRQAAAGNLSDTRVLASAALADPDIRVRRAAAGRLAGRTAGPETWRWPIEMETRLEFAGKAGADARLASLVLAREASETVRLATVSRMSDHPLLVAAAVADPSPEVRHSALRKLSLESLRGRVAEKGRARAVPRLEKAPEIDGDLAGWPPLEPLALRGREPGQAIEADLYLARDDEYLYFAASVLDREHFNDREGAEIWDGDAVQVALDPIREGAGPSLLGFALASGRPRFHRWRGPEALDAGTVFAVTRDEEAGRTVYEARLPLESLGLPASGQVVFGFNAVVFDDLDGQGQDYRLELAPGLAQPWNEALFPRFMLTGEP